MANNMLLNDLTALLQKHNVLLYGELRVMPNDRFENQFIVENEIIKRGISADTCGPFLTLSCTEIPQEFNVHSNKSISLTIRDADVLLKDGVFSHADGKTYTNRREWDAHLKARNLREVGNDMNEVKSKPIQGDYKCKPGEVARAIEEVKARGKYQ